MANNLTPMNQFSEAAQLAFNALSHSASDITIHREEHFSKIREPAIKLTRIGIVGSVTWGEEYHQVTTIIIKK